MAGFAIEEFLAQERGKDLLRFSTAGSVDDGKSTLIGRLLYDTRSVYEDQLRSLEGKGTTAPGVLDLALLTDGLRAEREQGITIDVAYRYFSTARRKYILADTPGHEQYTRNMATGCSTASLAVVLVDARKGVLVQSRRHACVATLLGVRQVVVAVNKMDLVGYAEGVFAGVRGEFEEFFARLRESLGGVRMPEVSFLPVSALTGENVVRATGEMGWYGGGTLLDMLEGAETPGADAGVGFRMGVQRVVRGEGEFRGFAGQIAAGRVRPGDQVRVMPGGGGSRVRRIVTFGGELEEAFAPMSVTLELEEEVDISRGDLLVAGDAPAVTRELTAWVVWMGDERLEPARRYVLKMGSRSVPAQVVAVVFRLDVTTLEHEGAGTLGRNDVGLVEIETAQALAVDRYGESRGTGSFILMDAVTNATVAGGMVREPRRGPAVRAAAVTAAERRERWGHGGLAVEVRGSAELVDAVERALFARGALVVRVEGAGAVAQLVAAGALALVYGGAGEAEVRFGGKGFRVGSAEEAVRMLQEHGGLRG